MNKINQNKPKILELLNNVLQALGKNKLDVNAYLKRNKKLTPNMVDDILREYLVKVLVVDW
jgi:hypothetical protein